jgi:hypothetical protein
MKDARWRAIADSLLPERYAALHITVRIPPGPAEYSWGWVDHLKHIPNLPGVRFEHRIHEQILGRALEE